MATATRTRAQPEAPPEPSAPALGQLLRVAGSIVAPTTLLTALLFFFGWSHAYWFFEHFGVNSTLLGLTSQDYVMRSVDGLFFPLTVVASLGLLAGLGHALLPARLRVAARLRTTAATVAGLALLGIGLWGIVAVTAFEVHPVVSPLCLGTGVLLLAYAAHRRRATHRSAPRWVAGAEWAGVALLVSISLFWAVADYSAAAGSTQARRLESRLGLQPDVVVYSAQSLSLGAPGVLETTCEHPDAAYRYRYDGLKLVLQAGDSYLFLPEVWSRSDGVAVLLPRSDTLRLEFLPASATADSPRC